MKIDFEFVCVNTENYINKDNEKEVKRRSKEVKMKRRLKEDLRIMKNVNVTEDNILCDRFVLRH